MTYRVLARRATAVLTVIVAVPILFWLTLLHAALSWVLRKVYGRNKR